MESRSDSWTTPLWFFDYLNIDGKFNLDVAASGENALCSRYFTEKTNGLIQSWDGFRVWCNPPWSNISPWVEKLIESINHGKLDYCVMLLPLRGDQGWFHELLRHFSIDLTFHEGRIAFGDPFLQKRTSPREATFHATYPCSGNPLSLNLKEIK